MTVLPWSPSGSAVDFTVLNNKEVVGNEVFLLGISVVCEYELFVSFVAKVESIFGVTDVFSV